MAVCLTSRGGLRVIVVSLLFLCSSSYSYAVYLAMFSCVSIFHNLSGLPLGLYLPSSRLLCTT